MNRVIPTAFYLQENDAIPNNPDLPVLLYRDVLDSTRADKHRQFQHYFEQNGWKGIWKNGLYDYHHFHSSSHEALGIASGSADMELGGDGEKTITVKAGDLILLPAGTGHRRVSASENLVIIGAYPEGQQNYDVCRSKSDYSGNLAPHLKTVPLPKNDPIYGSEGPLLQFWNRRH